MLMLVILMMIKKQMMLMYLYELQEEEIEEKSLNYHCQESKVKTKHSIPLHQHYNCYYCFPDDEYIFKAFSPTA